MSTALRTLSTCSSAVAGSRSKLNSKIRFEIVERLDIEDDHTILRGFGRLTAAPCAPLQILEHVIRRNAVRFSSSARPAFGFGMERRRASSLRVSRGWHRA